jgi:hypothetical protein
MFDIKQSTSRETSFFLHDANGDAVTAKVDGDFTKRIKKEGGAWGAMTVTITEEENGWYKYTISTSHSDTVGYLYVTFTVSGGKQVNHMFNVTPRILSDLAYPATSGRSLQVEADGMVHADVKEWLASAPSALQTGRVDCYVGAMASAVIAVTNFAANSISSDVLAQSAAQEIAGEVWDIDATSHQTQGTFGQAIGDPGADADTIWSLCNTNLDATMSSRGTSDLTAVQVWTYVTRTLTALGFVLDNTDAAWVDANERVDLGRWLSVAPNALQTGRVDSYTGAMAAGVIAAATFTAGSVDANALNADAAAEIADKLLGRNLAGSADAGFGLNARSVANALRALRNKWTSSGGTLTVFQEDDSTTAWTSALTADAAADPVVTSDPT